MLTLIQTIILADGWRRNLIALLAGATGALAMAPVDAVPLAVVPLTVAVWLLDGSAAGVLKARSGLFGTSKAALRAAFVIGWWWGFGFFLAGLWWLGAAFLVEAEEFAWALPFGVIGLPALLAFYSAFGFLFARLLWTPGFARVFALAAGLGLSEWLRGHLFTGFPWNVWGMVLGGNIVTGQAASLVGLYGLTIVTVAIFAMPAVLFDRRGAVWRTPAFVAAVVALVAIVGFGAFRLAGGPTSLVPGVKLRIMQPNLAQDAKFRPENKDEILAHYLALSGRGATAGRSGLADVNLLVWPESAFPFLLSRDPQALAQIGGALPPGTILVTGAARAEEIGRRVRFFNSVMVIASGGTLLDVYDKVHLVPFGEYLPFDGLLERIGLRHFVHIPGGFTPGTTRRLLSVPGLPPVAPLVCYEAIFPGEVVPPERPGGAEPGLLLNVTNDGWFGRTAGPYQHFAEARLRSIEEGLPLVRAANTGISAVVDAYGRVLSALPLGVEGVLDAPLPERIAPPLAARYPFLPGFLLWAIALAIGLVARLRI